MAQGQNRARIKRGIPNGFTLANAICGFTAILSAAASFSPSYDKPTCLLFAAGLIMLAMLFDAFDGRVARMTGTTSNIGADLDSLSDGISFGLAPAFVFFQLVSGSMHDVIAWAVGALYLGCTIMRLARFNVETPDATEDSHLWFSGLPSTGGAFIVGLSVVVFRQADTLAGALSVSLDSAQFALASGIVLATIAASLLMVSRIPFPHVNWFVRKLQRGK